MAAVNAPSLPDEFRNIAEVLPYNAPAPFYQGARVMFNASGLQQVVVDFLMERGVVTGEEHLVFSWATVGGEVMLTVAKHEAVA